MWAMNRINRMGIQYFMTEVDGMRTQIRTGDKSITVDHPIQQISQAWYDWMISGQFVQTAFHFLTSAEREFLITGMTPEDWEKVFPPDEFNLDSNEGDN